MVEPTYDQDKEQRLAISQRYAGITLHPEQENEVLVQATVIAEASEELPETLDCGLTF